MVQVDGLAVQGGGGNLKVAVILQGEGVLAGIQVDVGTAAQDLGGVGGDLLAGHGQGGDGGIQLGDVGIDIVAGVVGDDLAVALVDLDVLDGQAGIVVPVGDVGEVVADELDGGACGLIQQTNAAVGQLGQAGVGVEVGGDIVGIGQLHGVVLAHQEDVDVAVDTAGGDGGGDQDDILAIDLLGVLDGSQLAAGVLGGGGGDLAGGDHIVVHGLVVDIVGVAQGGVAVAVEHADGAVGQNHGGGLGGPGGGGGVLGAGPVALGVHPDQAGALVAGGVLIGGEDHVAVGLMVGAVAGADQQGLLGLFLQVQQLGGGPVQTVLGGGHVQVIGGVGLIGGVGEEQVGVDGAVVALDIEVGVNGVALDSSTVLLVQGQGLQIQVVVVGGVGCHGVVAVAADGDGIVGHITQQQVVIVIEAVLARHGGILGGIQGDAGGPQVGDQVGLLAVGGDAGVDEAGGQVVVDVTVVAQVVGEGVGPVCTVVRGDGNDGVQAGAVAGVIPAGVAGGDQSTVIQGDDTGDTEVLAATGAGGKGLTLGGAVGRSGADGYGQRADGKHAQQHTQSQTGGNDALCFLHRNFSFFKKIL